jgi:hypothetical protein
MKYKGINWDEQPLGEMTDRKIGKMLGVSAQAVYSARKVRGIQASDIRVDWDNEPLGEGPDRLLAIKHGVDVSSVQKARHRRGIPDGGIRGFDWYGLPWENYTDSEIARMIGRNLCVVVAARCRIGAPRFVLQKQCPCGVRFETSLRKKRFCSERCFKAVSRARLKHGGGRDMEEVYATIAKMRRIVSEKTGRRFKW